MRLHKQSTPLTEHLLDGSCIKNAIAQGVTLLYQIGCDRIAKICFSLGLSKSMFTPEEIKAIKKLSAYIADCTIGSVSNAHQMLKAVNGLQELLFEAQERRIKSLEKSMEKNELEALELQENLQKILHRVEYLEKEWFESM